MTCSATANLAARRVAALIDAEGVSIERVAQATDIECAVLRDRLACKSEFTLDELTDVGGLFRVPPDHFLKEAS
jgi:hypothetical protein